MQRRRTNRGPGPATEFVSQCWIGRPGGLVSLDISNARNSGGVLGEPTTHFLIRPRPLEGMGVKPVVLRPRGHHVVDVLPAAAPRPPLQVAMAEGVVEQLPLV